MSAGLDASMAALWQLHQQSARKQQQIQELQHEKRTLDSHFEAQVLQHAQADCRQLANMMHAKLPQELRDLVYQYLYLLDAPIPIGSCHFTTYVPEPLRSKHDPPAHSEPAFVIPEGATKQDHSIVRDPTLVFPDSRLLSAAYLGYAVARDASRYYYSSNTFSLCTLENTISDFLFTDPAHHFSEPQQAPGYSEPLGLMPIDHIRNLQIRVKYEHYDAFLTFYETLHAGEENVISEIHANLDAFTSRITANKTSQLNVEICLMTAFEDGNIDTKRRLINLYEAIRRPFYTLKHEFNARVTLLHHDEKFHVFPKDITGSFRLTKEQWDYEKSAVVAPDPGCHALLPHFFKRPHREIERPLSADRDDLQLKEDLEQLQKQRWGFTSIFSPSVHLTISKGMYWP